MAVAPRSALIKVEIGKGDVRTIQRGKTWAQFEHLPAVISRNSIVIKP
jgi:hypothetical protein